MRNWWILLIVLLAVGCAKPIKPTAKEYEEIPRDTIEEPIIELPQLVADSERVKIQKYFRKFVRKRRFNGHVLVAKGDVVIFDTTAGYANIRRRIPLKKNSAIQLASVTKPITATVILQLIEEGKLSFEDTITKFLPNLPEPYKEITVGMLLAHRSGLSQYYYYCDHIIKDKENMIYNDTVLCVIDANNPDGYFRPGKRHNYCNTNYVLLASIIESIENKRYADVLEERIFIPYKMKNSFVVDIRKDSQPENMVFGHTQFNRQFEFDYLDGIVGDKGIFSTARDLYEFDRYLTECGIVEDSLLGIAHTPQNKVRHNTSYGYGWRLRFHPKLGKVVYHTGWWHGNRHVYFKIPESDYTVIILSNALRGSVYNLNEILETFVP